MLLSSLVVVSCDKDDPNPLPRYRQDGDWGPHLIAKYRQIDNLLAVDQRSAPLVWIIGLGPHLTLGSDSYLKGSWKYKKTNMDQIIVKSFNDLTFNPYEAYSQQWRTDYTGKGLSALAEDIVDMELICLDDYDENHPSGSSVADIVDFSYLSCYEYIQQGYEWNEHSIGNGFGPSLREEIVGLVPFSTGMGMALESIVEGKYNEAYGEMVNHIQVSEIAGHPLMGVNDRFTYNYTLGLDRMLGILMFKSQPAEMGVHKFRLEVTLRFHCGGYAPRKVSHEFSKEFGVGLQQAGLK